MKYFNKSKNKHKINHEVRFEVVRLVGDGEPKLMSSYEASKLAQEQGKDLILINENQNPPIVRIEDYKKFLYDTEKAEKERKKNSSKSLVKEIQLSTEISENDLNTKARKGKEFLEEGHKVKCVLQLRGRQNHNPERGEMTILKYLSKLEDSGVPENLPKLESSKWIVLIKPKKK